MFGLISKKKLKAYMNIVKSGSRANSFNVNYEHPISEKQQSINAYAQGYEDGTDNLFNAVCVKFNIKKKWQEIRNDYFNAES